MSWFLLRLSRNLKQIKKKSKGNVDKGVPLALQLHPDKQVVGSFFPLNRHRGPPESPHESKCQKGLLESYSSPFALLIHNKCDQDGGGIIGK